MKEELKSLKQSTVEILKAKQNLKKQQMFFNMKVEEQKAEANIDEVFNDNNNSYEAAKQLNDCFPSLHLNVLKIRGEHPEYGNLRIKELVLNEILNKDELLNKLKDDAEEIVDNYFLYERCGFFKLMYEEIALEALLDEAKVTTSFILDESKQTAINIGNSIKNIVKPYGEIAKSQLNDVGETTKKLVNKGSKKLI